jgi:F-type H+-transporting ATPase subunit b
MEKLGIDPKLLLAQIVNFAIIIVVLSKFLYKPILSMLEKRKKEIEEGLKLTTKMREEEEKSQQKKQKMLETARKEAQVIIDEARKQAKEEEKEIVAQAHKEAEAILTKGKADVEAARVTMEKGLQATAVELAVSMAERLLTGVLSADEKHKLIGKHIKELESMKV